MPKEMPKLLQNNIAIHAIALTIVLITVGSFPAFPQTPDEQYMAGCASFVKGDYTKAVEGFSLAIMHNNSDEKLYIKRGASLLYLNDIDGAVADFEEANLVYPGVADLWLARTYALSDKPDKAIPFLKSHLSSEFRLPEDSIKKDPAFDKLQATPEWYTLWQQDWYNAEEKFMADVNYFADKKLYDKAISLLDDEIIKTPANPQIILLRGQLYFKQGNYATAIADFSTAINLDRNLVSGYSQRGLAYLKAGRYKDAVNDFNKALKADPGNFKLYTQRAEAYAGQQVWTSAIKDILLYLKYFESDHQALYQCGEYYFDSEDFINALKCFNRNLKEDPNNSLYYKARGKTYIKTATYRYALSDLSMSLDLQPDDAETWMFLGIAKIQSGDKENGCSDLDRAKKMGYTPALKYIIENCQ
jgi:tetratricopeptide (TPR) repeat protein